MASESIWPGDTFSCLSSGPVFNGITIVFASLGVELNFAPFLPQPPSFGDGKAMNR